MAYYAALVSLVQLLKDITIHHRYPNFLPDKHQLQVSLYEKFNLLLEMLDDYSPKDPEEETNDVLERRIRDVAYRAQDIIESHISTTLLAHIHLEKRTSGVGKLRRLWNSTFRNVPHNTGEDEYVQGLEKVKTEVDSVLQELTRIKEESNTIHEDLQPNSYISVEASRVKASSGKNSMLVFNEDLRTTMKAQLCGESPKLEVISIVGMGGLGKTTLARNIFDDRITHDHFDCRVWITISQDYHVRNILLAIINSLNINKTELEKEGEVVLQQHIYQNLFERRYLIVMDDVWETRFWDDVRRIFPDNSNGSRIIITTRLFEVVDYASSSRFHHQMQFLDEDQSWTLLREKVFAAQEHCPEELEVIGKLIAKNCRGLPLAIVVIAGVLSNVKRTRHEWENILRKVSTTITHQHDQHLSTILSLSYNNLPHHLKPCFLYLGGYPEDHEIRVSQLIKLWVAEGFVKANESKSLEEVGEEYFRDLVNRNLVLITQIKSNGRFKCCIIHDILRDLCSQRAHAENFFLTVQRKNDFQRLPMGDVRRVYVQNLDEYSKILKYIKKHGSHVRSLIYCSCKPCREDKSLLAASNYKLLRILDTSITTFTSFSHEISELLHFSSDKFAELLHLRYLTLNLRRMPVPSSIFHLQNLQTLIFPLGARLRLPSEIWKMPQLRHVMSPWTIELPPIPYGEVRIINGAPLLGNLQTLSGVVMFRFTSDTIEMIPNLKKLRCGGFSCKGNQNWEEYGLRNLVHLHQLETLYIHFDSSTWGPIPLLENFAFPSTLIKLTLAGCKVPWKDMSIVGSLPNLQVLKLIEAAFLGEEWEPIEGEFLELKFLQMEVLPDLRYWRAENTHFPRLEQLHIISCFELEEIPPEIGDIPTLQLINLDLEYCKRSTLRSSALEIQEQQRDLGNEDLRVLIKGTLNESDPVDWSESDGSESDGNLPVLWRLMNKIADLRHAMM